MKNHKFESAIGTFWYPMGRNQDVIRGCVTGKGSKTDTNKAKHR